LILVIIEIPWWVKGLGCVEVGIFVEESEWEKGKAVFVPLADR
jgi:hypothetical protein